MSNYQASSIESLDYFEHIRRYPGMYVGSKDIKGLHHCLKEIISNSIDEYLNGAGTQITIELLDHNGVRVIDNGRGIPHGKHPSGCSVLQACFGIANTGGKFNNATGESGYNTSGGEHGTGGKAVNALSTKMIVSTAREGLREIVEFSKGQFVKYSTEKTDDTGVSVEFYPDAEIFETIEFDENALKAMIQEFSFLCKGLSFVYRNKNTKEEKIYLSTKGLYDYINYLNKTDGFLCEPFYLNEQEGNFQVEAVVGYNNSFSSSVKLYTNNIPQEKGTHLTGFKSAWTSTLNKYAKTKGWLKEKDSNLTGADLEEGQILILNFKMIDPVFKGQNKEELSSSEGRTYVQRLTATALEELLLYREKDLKKIFDKALSARKARDAAKKARDKVREGSEAKGKSKFINLPTKLVDAWSKNRNLCELFVTEGDSAANGLIAARNGETQAIFPIRGKIISCRKQTVDKIYGNQEVSNIVKALGLDVNKVTGKLIYNPSKLRYNRIIFAADADPDGEAIKNLLITCFWWLCPELFLNGHICVAIPPLFRITTKKNEYVYLRDAKALEEYKSTHIGEKFLINRCKGLGEQGADELEYCLLDPKTRNVQQLEVEDAEKTDKLLEILMGTSVPPRREYLLKYGEEAEI